MVHFKINFWCVLSNLTSRASKM